MEPPTSKIASSLLECAARGAYGVVLIDPISVTFKIIDLYEVLKYIQKNVLDVTYTKHRLLRHIQLST